MPLNFYEFRRLLEGVSMSGTLRKYSSEDLVAHLWRQMAILDKLDVRHPKYGNILQYITQVENELKRRGVKY
jgi:hypothetical protein